MSLLLKACGPYEQTWYSHQEASMAQDRKGGSVVGIYSSLKVWLLVCGRVMSLKEREKLRALLGCGARVRLSEVAYSPAMAE